MPTVLSLFYYLDAIWLTDRSTIRLLSTKILDQVVIQILTVLVTKQFGLQMFLVSGFQMPFVQLLGVLNYKFSCTNFLIKLKKVVCIMKDD